MKSVLLKAWGHPRPVRGAVAKLIQRLSLLSYRDRLTICAVERPHYGHCIFEAAQLASCLNYPKISVIEFGCGGGNGLINAEMHILEIGKIFPVEIELYGFDTGEGLPPPQDYRDFVHYFKARQYDMNQKILQQRLKKAKLVLGEVRETCKSFFSDFDPAPVGCVFYDLDFYSSTNDALALFEADSAHFLPRIFMYFDDIIGDNKWLPSEFSGESLAIKEFNENHSTKKIAANRFAQRKYLGEWWSNQIFIYHDFQHEKYNVFVADDEQAVHEDGIRLR